MVKTCAPVAQLDRALASGAKGHRFESCRARQRFQGRTEVRPFFFSTLLPAGTENFDFPATYPLRRVYATLGNNFGGDMSPLPALTI